MMQMPPLQQMHMQQQVPNQSQQQPPQAQQQPPSQTQQTAQTPHLQQNQHFLSAHSQADQNQRNGMKQREQALFNSYVYDFLKRSGAQETARTYLREGGENIKLKNDGTNSINGNANSNSDSDGNAPLPEADVPVQAPEGFLYEWWSVFWDIYSAKLNRPGTMEAQRYVAAELRRGNRMHIPTMNAYQQHPQVVTAQAAAAQQQHQQQQQQQMQRIQMQQIPQHPQQQAQQAQQASQPQQQQQQAPPQQSQPPQPPQQTPQPQPQPSPANHQQVTHQQSQQFNNRQQMPNGVIDANNTNGDMLTSPRTMKMTQTAIRRPMPNMNIPLQQIPRQQQVLLAMQQQHQHQALQNTAQAQAHQAQVQAQAQAQAQAHQAQVQAQAQAQIQAQVQSQAAQAQVQNSQQIQSQGQQQQNPGVNQGQVQQQAASQIHMTPNQVPAQLNPGTKRTVEGQTINQNMSQQATSPNKRQRMMENYAQGPRQQQQPPNHQQGQIMNQNLMLTTPISNDIASSPDKNNRQAHITNGKKGNPQLQQLTRTQQQQQQMAPINKSHVNQQINPMVQNQITHESDLVNQINNLKSASNQSLSSISSFPMLMNQGVRLPQNYVMAGFPISNPRLRSVGDGHKIDPRMLLAEKSAIENFNKRNLELMGRPNIPQQLLYFQQPPVVPHQVHTAITADPNNSPQHLQRKNDAKGVKGAVKTTTAQSQPQPSSGNASNVAIPQQSIIGTNGVQTQSQPPNQATSTTSVMNNKLDGSLNMNLDEVKNYYLDQFDMEGAEFDMSGGSVADGFDINDFVTFDIQSEDLGSSNNAGPSTSTTNGN